MSEFRDKKFDAPSFRPGIGRIELFADQTPLTQPRGVHLVINDRENTCFSTESDSTSRPSSDDPATSSSKLGWFPVSTRFSTGSVSTGAGIAVEMDVEHAVSISEILVRVPLRSQYDIVTVCRESRMVLEHECGLLWSGIPSGGEVVFASSQSELPPVRIILRETSMLNEMRIVRRVDEGIRHIALDIVRFGSASHPQNISPGSYHVADFSVEIHPGPPPVLRYPKGLFSEHPLETVWVDSSLASKTTNRLFESIRERVPVTWRDGRIQPVQIRELTIPSRPREILEVARRMRSEAHASLLVRMQPDLYTGFGWRFNLLGLFSKIPFKVKMDPAGNNLFIANDGRNLIRRTWGKMQILPKRLLIQSLKIILLIGWMVMVPIFFSRERRPAGDKR